MALIVDTPERHVKWSAWGELFENTRGCMGEYVMPHPQVRVGGHASHMPARYGSVRRSRDMLARGIVWRISQ